MHQIEERDRSTTAQIFTSKQIFQKFWEYANDFCACFDHLEKHTTFFQGNTLWVIAGVWC